MCHEEVNNLIAAHISIAASRGLPAVVSMSALYPIEAVTGCNAGSTGVSCLSRSAEGS